ncbi:hypothetical protein FisN_31Hh085 [Fistulifera solaris]|uniref:Calcium permeable stress-gated cation channel 1 n=1 Tax=Fistulifera solaris TaxID=1519565 RepID=A0A1Z5JA88_FISSO|nr:hypothetical protein FisN_31Hh085 [Fistulifera solaris]|eukprot:GAX10876.1 hypothetical protein FisN_31Hh085 [Fistulifera solaris]
MSPSNNHLSESETRWLQEENSSNTGTTASGMPNDSAILRDMVMIYGSIFVVAFIGFCWVRKAFPKPYTVRMWTKEEDLKNPLVQEQYGFFSWIGMLFTFHDDEIAEHCGLDAVCFLRTLAMGQQLCMVGMFNALWLIPIYATAESSKETDRITDWVVQITVSHVPPGSARLVATVVAAYVSFGYTMYLILQEFEWFIEMRHKFLRKPRPCNYTVYVSNIPSEIRSNQQLKEFFRHCFSGDPVVDAKIRLIANKLSSLVTKREAVVAKLENALALEERDGKAPTLKTGLVGGIPGVSDAVGVIPVFGGAMTGDRVNAVDAFARELAELNSDISARITVMEDILSGNASTDALDELNPSARRIFGLSKPFKYESTENDKLLSQSDERVQSDKLSYSDEKIDDSLVANESHSGHGNGIKLLPSSVSKTASGAVGSVLNTAKGATKVATNAVGSAVNLVAGDRDGEYYSGGFVSFRTLSLKYAALQMLHHDTPFMMSVAEAPDPQDVFWANVGRENKELQIGKLLSRAASVGICLLWTIPMAFFATLSTVEGLKEQFQFVEDAIEAFPALEPILQQLAPLLVVMFNSLLPAILEMLSMWEGPVSGSVVEALTFSKLAAFMIIQTFFVTAISGAILEEIKKLVEDPLSAIDLLATSLPAQSTFFVQLAFVGTVTGLAFENIRIIPLALAYVRRFVGPRVTKKQRQTSYYFFRPLADPSEFEHASNMAQFSVLYFMIFMVYQSIAPLTCFFLGVCFMVMRPAFLHQFVYIYPTLPDSGGRIWINFIRIIMVCMTVAQLTLVGLMGLKKAGIATPLMAPLIICTILFNAYLQQQHFRVAEYLPTKECLKVDIQNGDNFADSLVKGAYLQKELSDKEVFPEDVDDTRLAMLGLKSVEEASPSSTTLLESSQHSLSNKAEDDDVESRGALSLLGSLFSR